MNSATATANSTRSSIRSGLDVSPLSHRRIDQLKAYPSPGTPLPSGSGTATGRCGARIGNHRSSLSTAGAYPAAVGNRTVIDSPSRYVRLSHPSTRTGSTGSSAHCGN